MVNLLSTATGKVSSASFSFFRSALTFFSPSVSGVWMPMTTTPLSLNSFQMPLYQG
jgi:hypothetical protein